MPKKPPRPAGVADMTVQEAQSLLDDLDDCSNLTDWEIDRIDEWLKKTDKGVRLTQGQADKLREIHEERMK